MRNIDVVKERGSVSELNQGLRMQVLFGYKVNFWLVPGNISHSSYYGQLSIFLGQN